MSAPVNHVTDAQKLHADGYIHLYELWLRKNAGVAYFSDAHTVTWQGHTYDSVPVRMGSIKESATEEQSRPTFTVFNPENVLASFVVQGVLEKSLLKRKRILLADLEANVNNFQQRTWFISRVTSFLKGSLTVELRNLIDGPNVMVPRRQYIPPEFPVVSLQ